MEEYSLYFVEATGCRLLFDGLKSSLKILAIGPVSLNDILNGVGVRAHNFISRLRSSHEIHYIHFRSVTHPQRHEAMSTAVIPEEPVRATTLRRIARWLRLGLPCDFSHAMERSVSQVVAERNFDVILTFDFALLQYATGHGLPVVADIIDEPVLSARRDLAITRGMWQKLRLLKHILELRLYLKRFCAEACKCVVVGQQDARSLHSILPAANIEVIPNGVDLNYFAPDGTASEPFTLLFFGNLGYQPNILALHYFAEQIFPIVRQRCPQARWYIVGPNYPNYMSGWNSDHVCVTGFVPDLRPYLAKAAVVISPLISGGGIKNKVLEAWAMRKPVVATSLGSSGIAAQDGKNILIADDAAGFARKTAELLLDPALADSVADGGYRTALENYSWDRAAEKMEAILQLAASSCATVND